MKDALMSKLVGIGMILVFTGGGVTAALAQSELKFTACVTRRGKIKKLQEGNEPLKNCNGRQIQIMFPSTDKTDQLMEDVTDLDEKTGLLMQKDMELMEKDTELMGDIDGLNSDVSSLNADVAGIQAEIDGPIADQLASLQSQIDSIVTSSLIGGDMDFLTAIGPGNATNFMGMYGSNTVTSENDVNQNLAASGTLTNLYVRSDAPGTDNTLTFTLRAANVDTPLTYDVTGASEACSVTSCVQVNEGDLISLRVDYVNDGDSTAIFDVRWNSRFVENGTCPEP